WTGFLHHSEIIRGAPAGPLLGRWVVLTRFRGRACRAPQLGIAWGINSRVRESTTKTGWTNTPAQDHWASPGRLAGRTRTRLQGGGRWFEPTSAHERNLSVDDRVPDQDALYASRGRIPIGA